MEAGTIQSLVSQHPFLHSPHLLIFENVGETCLEKSLSYLSCELGIPISRSCNPVHSTRIVFSRWSHEPLPAHLHGGTGFFISVSISFTVKWLVVHKHSALKCNVMVLGPPKTGKESWQRQYGSIYYGSIS